MLLHNLIPAETATATAVDLLLEDGLIKTIAPAGGLSAAGMERIDCGGAVIFPGLINSHDHLDFNLYPQLGYPLYADYQEWGNHIHRDYRKQIAEVLQVPLDLRVQWGIYKNLLNGFTTVVNHGDPLPVHNAIITVLQPRHSLHSAGFEKNWQWKLNRPSLHPGPYVMHAGEGTSQRAGNEIEEWIRWNLFRKKMIAVHGVAMKPDQAKHFRALAWCPASNFFMFGKTAAIEALKKNTTLLFGTDSTLTATWNAWEHFAMAIRSGKITGSELLQSLSTNAATVWALSNSACIAQNCQADLVVTFNRNPDTGSVFLNQPSDILLVVKKGKILLADASVWSQLKMSTLTAASYSPVYLQGARKYVYGDLPSLIKKIGHYYPAADFSMLSETKTGQQ